MWHTHASPPSLPISHVKFDTHLVTQQSAEEAEAEEVAAAVEAAVAAANAFQGQLCGCFLC